MKPIAALLAGFLGSLALFGSGAAVAVYFLMARPMPAHAPSGNVGEVSATEAIDDRPAVTANRRVEARPAAAAPATPVEASAAAADTMPTASIAPAAQTKGQDGEQAALFEAHVEWCANRYRSYRPRDDSYTPYSGGRRRCVSPFSGAEEAIAGDVSPPPAAADEFVVEESSGFVDESYIEAGAARYISADHVDYCFSRYRSYRPEDNSYQPYGFGPRRQCE